MLSKWQTDLGAERESQFSLTLSWLHPNNIMKIQALERDFLKISINRRFKY